MMRRWLLLFIGVAAAAGVYMAVPPRARMLPPAPAGLSMPVRGAIHVHTRRSDGTGTVEEVAAAASRAGLAFVVLTDHGDATRAPDAPSYRSGVLCIDAVEISTDGGHVVALGLPKAPYPLGGEARDVIEDVARLGGLSIAAHPDSSKLDLRWYEWTAPFDGLEWLNADSAWRDESPLRLARVLLAYPFRRAESLGLLLDRSDATLRRWDDLSRHRRIVAVAGADAHARLGFSRTDPYENRAALRIPGYEPVFRTFSLALPQVTQTGDPARDAAAVIGEIRAGHVYSAIDAMAGPVAFAFSATTGAVRAVAGDQVAPEGVVRLRVDVQAPADARISLIGGGTPLKEAVGTVLEYEAGAEPLVYRVEVHLPGAPGEGPSPWILSNPIYVGRTNEGTPAAARGPATTRVPMYADGPAAGWVPEQSPTSQAAMDIVPSVKGTQILFRFAMSGTDSASPFAALSVPAPGGLASYDRLTFKAHSDKPLRLSVQLRVPGAGEGERWRRSVVVDSEARDVTVFFDDMMPVGRTSARRPPLEKVGSILFVVDTVNARTGTAGRIFLDDVRLER